MSYLESVNIQVFQGFSKNILLLDSNLTTV